MHGDDYRNQSYRYKRFRYPVHKVYAGVCEHKNENPNGYTNGKGAMLKLN
jgi:hypothetical protein